MAETLLRLGGEAAYALLDWKIDPTVERIVKGWPTKVVGVRALAMGMRPNASFEEIVREYVRENPDAVRQNLAAQ
jgi:D-erythronate 2-dehydrogenase